MADLEGKIREAAAMLSSSEAVKRKFDFELGHWMELLDSIEDEDALDELLMILKEEQEMYLDVDKDCDRKKENNRTRLKQRVEKIKIEAIRNKNQN